jgi:hypothetical protein
VSNIFDDSFNDMPGIEMYRAEASPDLYPDAPRMLVENWPKEDREAYCGLQYVSSGELIGAA